MNQFSPEALALLSAGAGMLDPRGTYGSAGAGINKGIRQGLGTYLPMAQFQAVQQSQQQAQQDNVANNE